MSFFKCVQARLGHPAKPVGEVRADPASRVRLGPFFQELKTENVDDVFALGKTKWEAKWVKTLLSYHNPCEDEAQRLLQAFIREQAGLRSYEAMRSRVDIETASSRLSPFLRWGLLSPRALHS